MFIQIVDVRSTDAEGLRNLEEQWEQAAAGRHTVRRSIVTQDRDDPEHFMILAFFDSYESAMENSNLAETTEFAGRMAALLDGPPSFHNLDVIEDRPVTGTETTSSAAPASES